MKNDNTGASSNLGNEPQTFPGESTAPLTRPPEEVNSTNAGAISRSDGTIPGAETAKAAKDGEARAVEGNKPSSTANPATPGAAAALAEMQGSTNPLRDLRDILDKDALRIKGEEIINDFLAPLVDGAAEDLRRMANEINADFMEAIMLPPEQSQPLIDELGDQLELLAEKNRIRLVNGQWKAVAQGLALAGSIVSAVAAAASSGLSAIAVAGVTAGVSKLVGGVSTPKTA